MSCCLTHQHITSELSGSRSVPGVSSQTPSNREELTQATKPLDGKRNPKLFESQKQGSLASPLSRKDHAAFPLAAPLSHMWHLPIVETGMSLSVPDRQ